MSLNAEQNLAVIEAMIASPELADFLLQPTELAAMPSSSVSDALLALEEALNR